MRNLMWILLFRIIAGIDACSDVSLLKILIQPLLGRLAWSIQTFIATLVLAFLSLLLASVVACPFFIL
jgi:hypothetical protein